MSAMMPVLRKAEALLARVEGSDSKEEQRTCGVIFAKLFIEKKLYMVAELPREAPTSAPPWRAQKPDYHCDDAPRPRTIVTKFDCICLDCGSEIYMGDRCVWLKGKGCWHPECAP
jgi:hypothetical protein